VPIVDVTADGSLALSAAAGSPVQRVVVRLLDRPDGDAETLDADTSGTVITKQFDGGTLTLTGPDVASNFQRVLRTVTYSNASDSPDTRQRATAFLVTDGKLFGEPAVSFIDVQYVDSGPVLVEADRFSMTAGTTLAVGAGTVPALPNAVGIGLAANDVTSAADVGDPHGITVVDPPRDRSSGDLRGTLVVEHNGAFMFTSEPGYAGTVTFSYKVNDGFNNFGPVTVTIEVHPPVRQAGDANEDRQFDQRDIVAVLQAGKYRTGQPATWSEGDWNGDGVFDQFDIVASLQTGNYLQGPYAARRLR
jgi:hypothetical protein